MARCRKHWRKDCNICQPSPTSRSTSTSRPKTDSYDAASDLSNPISPLHQTTYGGPFYGTVSDSSGICDTSSSSSDSGSHSSSSYDSGSSSSSYDSGSSSSDCGGY